VVNKERGFDTYNTTTVNILVASPFDVPEGALFMGIIIFSENDVMPGT
jgi:hypothetical protein